MPLQSCNIELRHKNEVIQVRAIAKSNIVIMSYSNNPVGGMCVIAINYKAHTTRFLAAITSALSSTRIILCKGLSYFILIMTSPPSVAVECFNSNVVDKIALDTKLYNFDKNGVACVMSA